MNLSVIVRILSSILQDIEYYLGQPKKGGDISLCEQGDIDYCADIMLVYNTGRNTYKAH